MARWITYCAACQLKEVEFRIEKGKAHCVSCGGAFAETRSHSERGVFAFVDPEDTSIDDTRVYSVSLVPLYTHWLVWREWNEKGRPKFYWTRGLFESFVVVYGLDMDELRRNFEEFRKTLE